MHRPDREQTTGAHSRSMLPARTWTVCAAIVLAAFTAATAADPVPMSPKEPKWPEGGGECKDPVLMVVVGTIKPGASMKEYGKAVSQSTVYSDHRGYYVAISPLEMFEGSWPTDRIFLVAEFPCVEAARGMWFSAEYQERIRPLREGCCDLTVSVHRKRPNPFATPAVAAAPAPEAPKADTSKK